MANANRISCKIPTISLLFLIAALTLLGVQAAGASDMGNWPVWRGPTGQGHSDATGLPLHWSETENVVWKTPIHDLGYSTPVVWGDQVWLTTATSKGTILYAVCIDLNSGQVVHDVEVFRPEKPQRIHRNNSYATPSAVVEEGFVYVHYGTHGTACLDSGTGKVMWRRDDLHCDHLQGPVSSPVLYEDLLIVPLEGTDVQFTVALNKKTGEIVWRYAGHGSRTSNRQGVVARSLSRRQSCFVHRQWSRTLVHQFRRSPRCLSCGSRKVAAASYQDPPLSCGKSAKGYES